MDRLPTELLNSIVYFIETESPLPTRRSALASLARTNKTLHNIATPKLYLHVVLTSEQRVGQWGNVYASKVNPWNLKGAKDRLKDLVLPTSITFIPSSEDQQDLVCTTGKKAIPFPRRRFNNLLPVLSTSLTTFFFRNLTTLVVSPYSRLDSNFLASLLAPTQPLRANLVHLELSGDPVVVFILGAFNEFEFDLDDYEIDWETYRLQEAEIAAFWERYCDPDGKEGGEEPEFLREGISDEAEATRLISRAPFDWNCFNKLYACDWDPHDPDYIRNHVPKLYPFSKLESFTLSDPDFQHLNLLFSETSQFPSLTHLKLLGSFEGTNDEGEDEIEQRLLVWRIAVTKHSGSIVPPSELASLTYFLDDHGELIDVGPVPGWTSDRYAGLNLQPYFVAAVLGPTQALRTSLLNLDIQHDDWECATCFIFEAIGPFEFALDEKDFELERWEQREEERAAYWERCCSSDTSAGEEPEWLWDDTSFEATARYLISRAWTDFNSYSQLTLVGPRLDEPDFPSIRVYSFAKLESLTLTVTTNVQVKLILLLGLRFPSLSQVRLLGLLECEGEFPAFVLLWRVAVTERKGTLYPPPDEARLAVLAGFPQDRIENLESILATDANQAVVLYPGPNLLTLDVSELVVKL